MSPEMEAKLRRAYPTGLLRERDDSQVGANRQNLRLHWAIRRAVASAPIAVSDVWSKIPSIDLAITQIGDPPYWHWVGMGGEKSAWITKSGRPYVVLLIRISQVADVYYHWYNHWILRDDSEYAEPNAITEPSKLWKRYASTIFSSLDQRGFCEAPATMRQEQVPFVLVEGFDEVPEDDPRWEDDDFEPPLVEASLHKCLFGDFGL